MSTQKQNNMKINNEANLLKGIELIEKYLTLLSLLEGVTFYPIEIKTFQMNLIQLEFIPSIPTDEMCLLLDNNGFHQDYKWRDVFKMDINHEYRKNTIIFSIGLTDLQR